MTSISSRQRGAISGRPLPKRTDFGPAVCSQTDPPMPQPAPLWPSPRRVLRQRLTFLVASNYQVLIATHLPTPEGWKAELAWAPRVWITCSRLLLDSGPGGTRTRNPCALNKQSSTGRDTIQSWGDVFKHATQDWQIHNWKTRYPNRITDMPVSVLQFAAWCRTSLWTSVWTKKKVISISTCYNVNNLFYQYLKREEAASRCDTR